MPLEGPGQAQQPGNDAEDEEDEQKNGVRAQPFVEEIAEEKAEGVVKERGINGILPPVNLPDSFEEQVLRRVPLKILVVSAVLVESVRALILMVQWGKYA